MASGRGLDGTGTIYLRKTGRTVRLDRSFLSAPAPPHAHTHTHTHTHKHSKKKKNLTSVHATAGIRWSSPTQLLIRPIVAYVWQIGRDAQFSTRCGRMWWTSKEFEYMYGSSLCT